MSRGDMVAGGHGWWGTPGVGIVMDEKVTPSGELVVQVMWSDSGWLHEWCRSAELEVVTWTD